MSSQREPQELMACVVKIYADKHRTPSPPLLADERRGFVSRKLGVIGHRNGRGTLDAVIGRSYIAEVVEGWRLVDTC